MNAEADTAARLSLNPGSEETLALLLHAGAKVFGDEFVSSFVFVNTTFARVLCQLISFAFDFRR